MIRYSLGIKVEPYQKPIQFKDKIALMGSCFTENIGKKLNEYAFDTLLNPNGIVFNPISLAEPFRRQFDQVAYTESDLIFGNEKWASWFHHGKFSNENKEILLATINHEQRAFEQFISEAPWLIITFGTAWVYHFLPEQLLVANCHKVAGQQFKKRLLEVDEIVLCWQNIIKKLQAINPKINIIFTVSPVKHLRDGVAENTVSKATLHLSIDKLVGNNVSYFPAYELINDDLRDYRFYETDGAHPNAMAIDYVFDKFCSSVLSKEANEIIEALNAYHRLKYHKPLADSENNKVLLRQKLEAKREELIANFKDLKGLV